MAYITPPRVTVPTDLGDIIMTVTDGGHVSAMFEDHITIGAGRYVAHLHLYADTAWCDASKHAHMRRAGGDGRDVPPTHRQKIVDAAIAAWAQVLAADPDILRRAAYADANNDRDRVNGEIIKADQALRDLRKQEAALSAAMGAASAVRHPDGTPDARYAVAWQLTGKHEVMAVALFCEKWIGSAATEREAWDLANAHADFAKRDRRV